MYCVGLFRSRERGGARLPISVEYNGGLFYIGAGRLIRETNGLCLDPNSDDWYYIANGEVQVNYTGPVTYDGAEFSVINGMVY